MKRKSFLILLGGVFAALLVFTLFARRLPNLFSSVIAFPFEPLGAALRALALTGRFGSGLALALCTALSLSPLLLILLRRGEGGFRGETAVLCGMCGALFFALFSMANPTYLLSVFPTMSAELAPVAKGVAGCMVWSVVVFYLVLRLVKRFRAGDTGTLLRDLRVALYALCLLFDAVIALSCGSTMIAALFAVQQRMDAVMAVLRFAVCALPYVLDIGITLSLRALLDAYAAGDTEAAVAQAGALSRRCGNALGLTAASGVALNGLQLLFSRQLSQVSVTTDIPVISLAFVLLVLLLSRLIVENRRLQSDNDLFI